MREVNEVAWPGRKEKGEPCVKCRMPPAEIETDSLEGDRARQWACDQPGASIVTRSGVFAACR